ncbi:arginine N-succinyltransferase [Hydrocarboniclastica marina]|uniref:Arginine N-succinyltransferase n=1 Tax=Hydrocarboniclastica marina TaxID=2259620 RepID=A0A4V1D8Z1_9ALTE|nr:arginine N-succinyltransferase [Hydrocarboniclastica marina]QCF26870.1 arginine N-succinyltransferase [Hydrocarboniclastica marina]
MWIVRPARLEDVPAIESLAEGQRARVSTLPRSADRLAEKVNLSMRSFNGTNAESEMARYLFVLEDISTSELLGTAGIDTCSGNGQPFYTYRRDELIHASHELAVTTRVEVLYLSHELTGQTLLCSFAIAEHLRQSPAFALLSRSRLLFIAQWAHLFTDKLIVELQGCQDDAGSSPFWDSLGRHFFDMEFATADTYSGILSKTFLAELMPSHPIYVTLLSDAARAALGRPHEAATRSAKLLEKEGFEWGRHLDIFDGGPTLEATAHDLEQPARYQYSASSKGSSAPSGQYLVANDSRDQFRCALTAATAADDESLELPAEAAAALAIKDGARLLVVDL